ncbi:threonine ammonia-lyase [synthetic Mycoplasma mycoides JCVI-syn1.0]|uniref:L-threonine dehydratase catabolic TdcB n=1 Tax=Mycoplasma mycoides subsp. capri TaxID=40477 RepID=A0AB38GDQ4_MYCMC|nr:threonine ammonia-lyase [Mycoplasma mycoides]ADH21568.1 threonine ammonia-lyase [synthetic Mycoplasma mycoides JCVI-syn1.0]ACU78722.1 threonine ammonia-lyase [Mycoplasma mycoides subsp. capri str. GM12]ACU79553.1 threonine ammonia-lyase [Mycoplasma mycoides subsp. capri str. GM12]SRX60908.1 threonine ammonia-lyase [Mycoplasma mycoides subsp. capri]SRX62602.1 threonine ammonia-lyase [Mycoplasma mycoides subsp. capri]
MSHPFTVDEIKQIHQEISKIIHYTPLHYADKLSALTGNNIYLKLENLQKTGSFKLRGATNKISKLTDEEKRHGIIAASAGNHAQGVAYAATNLGLKSTIVMPENAPMAKIQATEKYGGKVVLSGRYFDDALAKAIELKEKENLTLIHAFDDIEIIKGQATIAYEIDQQIKNIDYCLVPIGGGGLMSGIATYLKQVNPNIKMIGVEAANVNSYQQAKALNKPVMIDSKPSIADGIAVKKVSDLTFSILNQYVDDVVVVSEEEIAETMLFLMENCKFVTEGSGAVTAAALMFDKLNIKNQNKTIVGLVSGGNIDIAMVGNIINKALIKTNRRLVLSVNIPSDNKELMNIISIINSCGAKIIKIKTNRDIMYLELNEIHTTFIIDLSNPDQQQQIIEKITQANYNITSITD